MRDVTLLPPARPLPPAGGAAGAPHRPGRRPGRVRGEPGWR